MSNKQKKKNEAFLCGRLLAILEGLRMETEPGSSAVKHKSSYIVSASTRPGMVLPIFLNRAKDQMKKSAIGEKYNMRIDEILKELDYKIPDTIFISEVPSFFNGYFKQKKAMAGKSKKA